MTDFTLTPTALKVIRNLAGRVEPALIARALDCSEHQLERIAREQQVSLKPDEPEGVR